jgi:membrane protein implicated in regulation of membrane protease activity
VTNSVRPVNGFLNWWDGIELWLSGLPFVLQALVVMPVVLALAYLTATVLDALLGKGIELMRRARDADGLRG